MSRGKFVKTRTRQFTFEMYLLVLGEIITRIHLYAFSIQSGLPMKTRLHINFISPIELYSSAEWKNNVISVYFALEMLKKSPFPELGLCPHLPFGYNGQSRPFYPWEKGCCWVGRYYTAPFQPSPLHCLHCSALSLSLQAG